MPRKNNDQHDPRQIMEDVLAIVRQAGRSGITSQQIALRLGIKDKGRRYLVFDALDVLLEEGRLTSGKKGRYHSPDGAGILAGTLEIIGSGAGFLRPEEGGRDVFIQQRDLGLALHGDRVKVKLRGGGGGRPEGKVLEVVERRRATYVGVVHRQQGRLLVVMDDPRINKPFFVPAVDSAKAREGDKVVVELGDWRDPRDLPRGRIVDVLGRAGEHDVEMHAILAEFGLPHDFPEDVVRAAGSIRDDRGGTEYAKRRDMREVPTLTIDPEDAKDLDDALSIRQLDNGLWEVGVHIADVSHYVKPGSRVDQEAVSRATSVYLVDRVVPMLPERLSNDLCSLNADEDKLTFSAIFHLDEQARIKDEWFGRTVIRSRRRFAYAEAKEAIDGA
ncbi:MAG TPA: RNB domain-containing ribonuclease, partial [Flavobacteriales bacterium]|nr:RNB domain-containing ribonuclease [Flavobacteriales bacterium]